VAATCLTQSHTLVLKQGIRSKLSPRRHNPASAALTLYYSQKHVRSVGHPNGACEGVDNADRTAQDGGVVAGRTQTRTRGGTSTMKKCCRDTQHNDTSEVHCTLSLLLSLILAAALVGAHTARHAAGTFCFLGAQQHGMGVCAQHSDNQPTPTCYNYAPKEAQNTRTTPEEHTGLTTLQNPAPQNSLTRTRQHGMRVHTNTTRGSTGCQKQHPHKLLYERT
jgi:hypothetical protein